MTRPRPCAVSFAIAAAITSGLFTPVRAQEHGWPLDPQHDAHTVANTLEPYWSLASARWRFHSGIDLPAVPYLDASGNEIAGRTLVRAVAAGKVVKVRLDEESPESFIIVASTSGERHSYVHLAALTVPQRLSVPGASVDEGEVLGAVHPWPNCDFNHLHFERRSADRLVLDPLADIAPRSDTAPPRFTGITIAPHEAFKSNKEDGAEVVPFGCVPLEAGSEVHARIEDQGDVGGFPGYNVGLRGLRLDWLPPGESEYLTIWDIRPTEVATSATSSADAVERVVVDHGRIATSGSYCGGKSLGYRLEGAGDGVIDPRWMGPGVHALRLHAVDFAGSASEATFRVCVAGDGFRCAAFPLVKDCATDSGLLPSTCGDSEGAAVSWIAPPGSDGAALEVCVTNGGCEPLDLSGTIAVRLELKDCSGPACAEVTGPWDRSVHGLGADSGALASGESRCLEVPLDPDLSAALASVTAGRLFVRVSAEKGGFASDDVRLDAAAASVEIPADATHGPPDESATPPP